MKTYKYFDKISLKTANDLAIRQKANRSIKEKYVKGLSNDVKFPILYHFFHTNYQGLDSIRCCVQTSGEVSVLVDCDCSIFKNLPEIVVEVNEN